MINEEIYIKRLQREYLKIIRKIETVESTLVNLHQQKDALKTLLTTRFPEKTFPPDDALLPEIPIKF